MLVSRGRVSGLGLYAVFYGRGCTGRFKLWRGYFGNVLPRLRVIDRTGRPEKVPGTQS